MRRIALLLFLLMLPCAAFAQGKQDGAFRVVTYNVGSFSKYLDNSIDMVAAMMLEAQADAIGFNEVDSLTIRNRVNQTEMLSRALGGWTWHFGNTLGKILRWGYGNSVLVPPVETILRQYTVPLGFYIGAENRCVAVIETEGYVIGAVHLDHKRLSVREAQINKIAEWAREYYSNSKKPVFLCGDFNAEPNSPEIALVMQGWELLSATENSFPSSGPSKCIDYIFCYKNAAPVSVVASGTLSDFSSGDVTLASDHLPVFADVIFPSSFSQSR